MIVGRRYDPLKRGIDLVASSAALILLLPIWIAVAVGIHLESAGPVVYRGIRVGRGGQLFRMLKFRTMVQDAERRGGWSTADDDPRITRIGRHLRRYKLDEIPNLVNVLRGEMSLVGPRAQVPADVARYSEAERSLLEVRPGITDRASIRFRNEGEILKGQDDPDVAYDRFIRSEKIRLGLEYVRDRSLRVDLGIIADTIRAVFDLPGAPPAADIPPKEST